MSTVVRIARLLKVPAVLKFLRVYRMAVRVSTFVWRKTSQDSPGTIRWKAQARRLYSQFIKPGDLVFDVGANRGTRVDVFRDLGATVVAVEPQEHCVAILQRKFRQQVFCEQVALGSAVGEAEMMIRDDADTSSTLSKEFIEAAENYGAPKINDSVWNRKITVKVSTLDNLIAKYGCPSFCKIDVEGYEYEVLMGLSQPVSAISIEFHPMLFEALVRNIKRLQALGFHEYNYSMGETMRLALSSWISADDIVSLISRMPRDLAYGDIYVRRDRAETLEKRPPAVDRASWTATRKAGGTK